MSRYTSLLPLSYMVPTFYPTSPGIVQPMSGAPRITLADGDLQARAQRLVNVLYWTAEKYQNQDGMQDPGTLKVFIAPEFYFRKASPEEVGASAFEPATSFGSYPESARQDLAQELDRVISGTSLFKDWTIVAGTICSALPDQHVTGRPNLLNTAIMLRGLRDPIDDSARYVLMEKHYISRIDGPPKQWHANRDPTTVYSYNLNPDQFLDNLVYWDGMSVGLEVCLDHDEQVLRNALARLRRALGGPASRLDLQLVTSCGMSITNPAAAVKPGGLVMLTDGMSDMPGLPEPDFQLGRFDAGKGKVRLVDDSQFDFAALPVDPSYQVLDYAGGLYTGEGRHQGVWAGQSRFALSSPP
ncbi:hypothetical protein [Luteibacter aegosomatissinici]|uniref:hypothetical protein n=1 Tax=Luteibacter aegosomatissinici TaxID=2911539 RepID=UPI001FF8CDEB|nr:hypothetical protein [Luteibacter aegosomatissinici]UPG95840.1 hypothetical protein L2Y97_06945 [Luteibacter aegosomatissinici]